MIEVRNVYKSFNNKPILQNVNLDLSEGNVYGFLGNNGAGKTTLMRIIFNMVKPDKGSISYNGIPQKDIDYKKWFYFTETDVLPIELSVQQYLKKVALLADISNKEFKKRLDEATNAISFDFKLKQKIKDLSSGQQKIASCLALLIIKPDVVFLDEPTANMDIKNQQVVLDIIHNLKKPNRIIVITTHLIKEIGDALTNVIILDQGTIKYDEKLKQSDNLDKIFKKYTSEHKVDNQSLEKILNE